MLIYLKLRKIQYLYTGADAAQGTQINDYLSHLSIPSTVSFLHLLQQLQVEINDHLVSHIEAAPQSRRRRGRGMAGLPWRRGGHAGLS